MSYAGVKEMIEDYHQYNTSLKEKISLIVILAVSGAVTGILFYNSGWITLAGLFLYGPAKKIYEKLSAERRRHRLMMQFRDFLYAIAGSITTGCHMKEAICNSEVELSKIYSEDEPIIQEVRRMSNLMTRGGTTDLQALQSFESRANIEDIDNFVRLFRACRETGGDIISAVNKGASVIGEKITIEGEIRTMVSQKKLEGRIIAVMPALVIIFLRLMSPSYLSVMYETWSGRMMMTGSLVVIFAAFVIIERITDIEV